MKVNAVEIRPISHRLGGQWWWLYALVEALLVSTLFDCSLSLDDRWAVPDQFQRLEIQPSN